MVCLTVDTAGADANAVPDTKNAPTATIAKVFICPPLLASPAIRLKHKWDRAGEVHDLQTHDGRIK